ncbi:MAG: DUF2887 domain-containing protein [Nostoc sp.]
MRRDAIFYTIFRRVPGLFFELVEQPPAEAASYRFESVEVKEPEEVEAMLGVKLEETRVYREAKQEGIELGLELGQEQAKLELIPRFLDYGISIEEVAQLLDLTIEQVEKIRLVTEQESLTSTL